jgi:hypothetical protein
VDLNSFEGRVTTTLKAEVGQRYREGSRRAAYQQAEAAILPDICARFASGEGTRRVASALNPGWRAVTPFAAGETDGWASTVRAVLERPQRADD